MGAEKAVDPRVNRTRELLTTALVELMAQRDVQSITVKALTERAQINRATFYLHYTDMQDFLEKTASRILRGMSLRPPRLSDYACRETAVAYHTEWLEYIAENGDFFTAVLGVHGIPGFRQALVRQGSRWYQGLLEDRKDPPDRTSDLPILVNFIVHGQIGMMEQWLASAMRYSPRYMAEQVVDFTYVRLLGPQGIQLH